MLGEQLRLSQIPTDLRYFRNKESGTGGVVSVPSTKVLNLRVAGATKASGLKDNTDMTVKDIVNSVLERKSNIEKHVEETEAKRIEVQRIKMGQVHEALASLAQFKVELRRIESPTSSGIEKTILIDVFSDPIWDKASVYIRDSSQDEDGITLDVLAIKYENGSFFVRHSVVRESKFLWWARYDWVCRKVFELKNIAGVVEWIAEQWIEA